MPTLQTINMSLDVVIDKSAIHLDETVVEYLDPPLNLIHGQWIVGLHSLWLDAPLSVPCMLTCNVVRPQEFAGERNLRVLHYLPKGTKAIFYKSSDQIYKETEPGQYPRISINLHVIDRVYKPLTSINISFRLHFVQL